VEEWRECAWMKEGRSGGKEMDSLALLFTTFFELFLFSVL